MTPRATPLLTSGLRACLCLAAFAAAEAQAPARPAQPTGLAITADRLPKSTGDLDAMLERRTIRVATTYNKTHYFIDRGVQHGVTYEAFTQFENDLNAKLKTGNLRVKIVFLPMTRDELLPAVADGRADLAAAALTVTPEREKLVDFSTTVSGVDEIVVSAPGVTGLNSLDDLSGRSVFVRKSSAYHANLVRLNQQLQAKGKPPIIIKDAPESLEDEDVLEMVNAGLVKLTVVNSHVVPLWKQALPAINAHPELKVAADGALAIAMRKNSPKLSAELSAWLKTHGQHTMFGNLMVKRYLQSTKFAKSATNTAEMKRFHAMVDIFRKYGETYDIDHLLMIAQGFQESGLDQSVKSKVGAVGVMQVMPKTGKDLAVGDIQQMEPNIHAGVKYIRFMIDRYYASEPMDRLNKVLFAFASYNAGPARIRQLRDESKKRGLDPNVWFDNVERVASERIGRETVQYVSNIFKYYVAYRLALEEMQERRKTEGQAER